MEKKKKNVKAEVGVRAHSQIEWVCADVEHRLQTLPTRDATNVWAVAAEDESFSSDCPREDEVHQMEPHAQ
jgi:hypothetical protein